MLKGFTTIALMIGACILLCVSCDEAEDSTAAMAESISSGTSSDPVPAETAPTLSTKALPVDVDLGFISAAAPASADDDATLSFAVKCDQTGSETITMTDPQNVESALLDLEFCKLEVKPTIRSAKTSGSDVVKAGGGYLVNLFDTSGKMMGAFETSETGSMALINSSEVTSYQPMLNFSGKNVASVRLDRFLIYPKALRPGDVYDPVLAIEYRQAGEATEYEFNAPDGYSYTYTFDNGTLRVYPAEALAELADEAASDTRAVPRGTSG